MEREQKKKKLYVILRTLPVAVALVAIWFCFHFGSVFRSNPNIIWNDGWDVEINGELFEQVNLHEFSFPAVNRGDVVTLTKTMPEENLYAPMLMIRAYHTAIHVMVGNDEVFSHGEKELQAGEMVGYGFFWITIPNDYVGKELEIEYKIAEPAAFSSLEPVYIQNGDQMLQNFVWENAVELLIVGFLLIVGIFCIVLYCISGKRGLAYRMILSIAALALLAAAWISSSTGILQFVEQNYYLNNVIEYSSLYCLPIFVLLFARDLLEEKKHQRYIMCDLILHMIYLVVVETANWFNLFHLQRLLLVYHLLTLCSFALIITLIIRESKGEQLSSRKTFLLGTFITIVICGMDILRFNIEKYIYHSTTTKVSIVPVAALCIVLTMGISYFQRLMYSYHQNVEKDTLMKIAYTDALTQINNRAKCEEVLTKLDEFGKKAAIVYMDLNYFKQINDSYGHAMGDEALKDFALILSQTMGKHGFVGRMAGDEFIAVFTEEAAEHIQSFIRELYDALEQFNRKKERCYELHAACGLAARKEADEIKGWDLCKRADADMYEKKKSLKVAR